MNYFQLALRNILRHKRRSFVTIITICLGFIALGVLGGLLSNVFSQLKGQAVVVEKLGHLTIAKKGFQKKGKIEPEKYLWEEEELNSIMSAIQKDDAVNIVTPRLSLFGIASNGTASTIFLTEGVDPKGDQTLIKTPIDGRTKTSGAITLNGAEQTDVAIGEELAENLGLSEGDMLTLLVTTKDGLANAMDVNITQVYNTGNPSTNDKFILMDFSLAQELYDSQGAQRLVLTLNNLDNIDKDADRIVNTLKGMGHDVEIHKWNDLSSFYSKVTTLFNVLFLSLIHI